MFQAYKKTSMNWSRFINRCFCVGFLFFSSCAYFETHEETPLTEREVVFEKGQALFNAYEYDKALPFFLKISFQPDDHSDRLYEKSLWNMSVIFEKQGHPEKALLTLQELEKSGSVLISRFKVRLAEMKNHFRVLNSYQALQVKRLIDDGHPLTRYSLQEIYEAIDVTTSTFNYDRLVTEELEYASEIQKYFIYVMESDKSPINAQATDLLISISEHTYALLRKDSLSREFRRKVAESLLDFLRRFDRYKIDDLNLNLKTVSKFSIYSEKTQKLITEWLHQ